ERTGDQDGRRRRRRACHAALAETFAGELRGREQTGRRVRRVLARSARTGTPLRHREDPRAPRRAPSRARSDGAAGSSGDWWRDQQRSESAAEAGTDRVSRRHANCPMARSAGRGIDSSQSLLRTAVDDGLAFHRDSRRIFMPTSRELSRRTFVVALGASTVGAFLSRPTQVRAAAPQTGASAPSLPYGNGTIPAGIRSRPIPGGNGLTVHLLEDGFERPASPAILLLHGFPELAFSWRKVMLPLAAAGYHVIAPDQRGYGRTTGWDNSYDADPDPFRMLNMVRDAIGLVYALGYRSVAVVGHDAGAPVAPLVFPIPPDPFPAPHYYEWPLPRPAGYPLRHRQWSSSPPSSTY